MAGGLDVAAYIAIAGIAVSQKQSHDARGEARKEKSISKKESATRNAKKRRQQIAKARRLEAQTIAEGEAQGIGGGSQVDGAAGSINT